LIGGWNGWGWNCLMQIPVRVLYISSLFSLLLFLFSSPSPPPPPSPAAPLSLPTLSPSPPPPPPLLLLLFLFLLLPLPSNDSDLDLDGDKGRQMLRVLVQMAMTGHAPLAASAIRLLIRHFSQRREMVNGFKQVYLPSVCSSSIFLSIHLSVPINTLSVEIHLSVTLPAIKCRTGQAHTSQS